MQSILLTGSGSVNGALLRKSYGKPAHPGTQVKGRIVAAGVALGRLAREAGMSGSTLTSYLSGRTRNPQGQIAIALAFSSLTGRPVVVRRFWGRLVADELG